MNWLIAHRTAAIAAATLRNRLGLPDDRHVDVFTALRRCGLAVSAQDMPSLFGVYLPARSDAHGGILLNSIMGEATMRHTGAHELGHAQLGHDQCQAKGHDLFPGIPREKWPDEEKQAEAFAAWFLMPIRAVKATLARLGLDVPRDASAVYQISLHLGTTYAGTVRHIQHLRLAKPAVAAGWTRVQPARLRARLSGQPDHPPARVWDLTSLTDGAQLHVEQGDRLIVHTPALGESPTVTGADGAVMLTEPRAISDGRGLEFDIAGCIDTPSQLTVTSTAGQPVWSGTLMPTPERRRGFIAMAHTPVLVGPGRGTPR
jgi:hypothetical protein